MIELHNLELQKLDKQGVEILIDWARQEGWNPGKYDYEVFWKTDPNGFYGFYFNGNLIAGGALVSYSGEYGFMGLFIVRSDYRGSGIGNKLWYLRRNLLISRLSEGAPIGMDGVVDMQPFYVKGGFNTAFKDERYECIGQDVEVSKCISSIQNKDFKDVYNYDKICFGFNRITFLQNWLNLPNSKAFKYTKEGEILGYTVIRKVDSGFKIGPLFAENNKIAEELYKVCLKSAIGQKIYLDIPMVNQGAIDLIKKYDSKYVFECARMYFGNAPKIDMSKVYGITTFELG